MIATEKFKLFLCFNGFRHTHSLLVGKNGFLVGLRMDVEFEEFILTLAIQINVKIY